jgi:GTP:adenosylcobinamide-phosphate guanylyltransferase
MKARPRLEPIPAIVLAGRRGGTQDELARGAGVTHKCLVPVAGKPLIAHVIESLAASDAVSGVHVAIEDEGLLAAVPAAAALRSAGRLEVLPVSLNLVESVRTALERTGFPAFVTTADNALLSNEALTQARLAAQERSLDLTIAFARERDVLAAHPKGQLRFYRFADDAYSNCNLFLFSHASASAAIDAFREGGQFAKHPGRILRAFGLRNLIAFRLGLRSLDATLGALSRRFGARIGAVALADGATAIDVDNERTRQIAESLLLARRPVARGV